MTTQLNDEDKDFLKMSYSLWCNFMFDRQYEMTDNNLFKYFKEVIICHLNEDDKKLLGSSYYFRHSITNLKYQIEILSKSKEGIAVIIENNDLIIRSFIVEYNKNMDNGN